MLYALLTQEGPDPADLDRFARDLTSLPDDSEPAAGPDLLAGIDQDELDARAARLVAGRL